MKNETCENGKWRNKTCEITIKRMKNGKIENWKIQIEK